jgi:glucose/mannose-6-phosphate isomerase
MITISLEQGTLSNMKINDYVKKYDPQNQFDVLKNSYQQIDFAWNNKFKINGVDINDIENIVISGLGGSAISGDLIKNFLNSELSIPILINRNYYLPKFAGKNTLFLASSYSGNTEETISALQQAIKAKCKLICVSTGGEVEKIAKKNKISFIKLQKGFQPRYALGLSFFTLLKLFESLKLIKSQEEVVKSIRNNWKKFGVVYSKEGNEAYNIAESLIGFIPIIYSVSDSTNSVGYRFKSQLNENSKAHAFTHEVPEMNHNEIIGWETYKEKQIQAKIIYINDSSYHSQIKKRLKVLTDIFSKSNVDIINLKSNSKQSKVRLLDLIYLVDWISYYLGVLRGYDPSEIDNIHYLKKKLQ